MGSQEYLNYSSTFFSDHMILSDNTTESSSDGETLLLLGEENARLIHIIVRPILIVVGTVGNILTIYIMRKTSLRNVSSCFYMSILGLADTSKYIMLQIKKKFL